MAKPDLHKLKKHVDTAVDHVVHRTSTIKTASGREIQIKKTIGAHRKTKKDVRARKRAQYLATMPKSRFKRLLFKLHPKRVLQFWFSREGAVLGLKLVGIGALLVILFSIGIFAYFRKDLPNIQDITATDRGGSIRYFDKTGQTLLWEDFESFKRIPVKFEEINQFAKDATVAIEDKDFYKHGGFNLRGIIRATISNARGGRRQGGSTITQQFVKNTQDWSNDVTITRKIKELILSVELERSYTKEDILAGYLNIVPYGAFEVGVESASQSYFKKSAKDLTLPEAAFLAAIPQSPQYYSPYSPDFDQELFTNRVHYILDLMYDQGKITEAQRDEAKSADLVATIQPRKPKYDGIKAPYFVLSAKDFLEKDLNYGKSVAQNGWKVITTLDLTLQAAADSAVSNGIAQVKRQGGNNASLVAQETQTGKVVAVVGGYDFNNADYGKINFATTPRAPGSSVKPYDYAAMMVQSKNWGAGSVLYDVKTQLDGWGWPNDYLQDYDKTFPGPMTVRYALAGSRNVPAVKAAYIAGMQNVLDLQKKMGIVSGLNCPSGECGLSAAIGDGAELKLNEHVNGFATFGRNGRYKPQSFVEKIIDNKDKVIYQWQDTAGEQVLDPQIAYIVGDMIGDPNASYMAAKSYFAINGHKMSMKTGTTNNSDNGWLMGYSTQYTAGVWVGRNDAKGMSGFMENMTGPIWYNFMKKAHENVPVLDRVRPDGIKEVSYDVGTSIKLPGRTNARLPSKNTDIFPSWYTPLTTSAGKRATIDTVTNKLATECTPDNAKKEVISGKIAIELPTGDPSYGKWAAAVSSYYSSSAVGSVIPTESDDLHKCDDIKPTISLSVSGSGGVYTMSATVTQGTHALKSVNFMIDGQILPGGSFDISGPGTVTYSYSSSYSGEKEIVAQVVDAALYLESASKAVQLSSSAGLTLSPAQITGNIAKLTWNAIGTNTTYKVCISKISSGSTNCTPVTTPNTQYQTTLTPGDYNAYVEIPAFGTSSNTVSFSI